MSNIFSKLFTFENDSQLLAVRYNAESTIRYTTTISGTFSTLDYIIEDAELLETTFSGLNIDQALTIRNSMEEARLING